MSNITGVLFTYSKVNWKYLYHLINVYEKMSNTAYLAI